MARIALRGFTGESPRTEPYYLPEQAATVALDAAMRGGSLTPFRANSDPVVVFETNRQTIYLHGAEWLAWNTDADPVPGPVAQDRLYISFANTAPIIRVDGAEYPLHLGRPGAKPTLTRQGTFDADTAELVAYAFTWVTSLGEESGPSPVSAPILWSPGTTITVGSLPATPPAGRLVTQKRIYRSVTSTSGATELFFVAEIPATDVTYIHDIATAPIAEAIPTADFNAAPTNLRGLTGLPNGFMAGFAGKELFFSEPFQPHAWPNKYRQTMNDTIIGLAAFGTVLAVLTTGNPVTLQGMHPDQLTAEKVEQPFPCMSKRGIVDMGYSAVFPSSDGLVSISSQGGQLISDSIWTREQWLALQPTTFIAARIGTFYAFSYIPLGGGARKMAMIDPASPQPTLLPVSDGSSAVYTQISSGNSFILGTDMRSVRRFDNPSSAKRSFTWRSKPFRLPFARSMGAIRVDARAAAGETMTTRIYADGVLRHTTTRINEPVRLPAGEFTDWQIEMTGTATVMQLAMAQSLAELG
ncbi:hypothetical protein [Paracoccus hibiscisoli]|uniref:Uncharacterized protein n=1 Tax=Paracoccus hibiscisoli TaxID=2023261 RepID=A0A4U0QUL3_9RHOB|nr:hypothetical protein [Paracoccus hibiscisoli]TJZ85833.1 hypothetical protein FA740_05380 [Paracoccus hibiscisoli]